MKKALFVLAALGFAGAALAQTPLVEDTDGDGFYSLEELQAVYPDLTQDEFALIDANGDGSVDEDELTAAQEAGMLTL